MEDVLIRKIKKSDITKVIEIGTKIKEFKVDLNMEGFWTKNQLLSWSKSRKDSLFLAEKDKKIIGFVIFSHHVPTGKAILENIWVEKDYRGNNIGEFLVKAGIEDLNKKGATYLCALAKTDNFTSIKFLENRGFLKGFDFCWLHKKI